MALWASSLALRAPALEWLFNGPGRELLSAAGAALGTSCLFPEDASLRAAPVASSPLPEGRKNVSGGAFSSLSPPVHPAPMMVALEPSYMKGAKSDPWFICFLFKQSQCLILE